jgi:hypothetical protein
VSKSKMTLRPLALHVVITCSLLTGRASAEIASRGTTNITANYGVYWAGLRFGDVRLVIKVRDSQYKMTAKGRSWAASSMNGAVTPRARASSENQAHTHCGTP